MTTMQRSESSNLRVMLVSLDDDAQVLADLLDEENFRGGAR